MESTSTAKGQATIPKAKRDHLGVKPGDRLKFLFHPDGSVVLLPKLLPQALRGIVLFRRRRSATIHEMSNAATERASASTPTYKTPLIELAQRR